MIYNAHLTIQAHQPYAGTKNGKLQKSLKKIVKLIKDPDAFQKICQVAMTLLQLTFWETVHPRLHRFIAVLDSANIDDLYEIFKLPSLLLDPKDGFLKKQSALEKLYLINTAFVNVMTVPYFLNEWRVFDSDQCLQKIFRSVKIEGSGFYLEQSVRIGLCVGFFIQLILSATQLRNKSVSLQERKIIKWEIAVSFTELVFNLSAALGADPKIVVFLTLVAKSTGLAAILFKLQSESIEKGTNEPA